MFTFNFLRKLQFKTSTMTRFLTREFSPASFEEEISANVNGNPLYPAHNMTVDPQTLRLINIHVSAECVLTKKLFSKRDPMCVLFTRNRRGWHEYGRTEVCWNILEPVWVRPFTFNVIPDKHELFRFEIYDVVEQFHDLKEQKFIGFAELDLFILLTSPTHTVRMDIISNSGEERGVLNVSFFDLRPSYGSLFFCMSAKGVKSSKRLIRKANPFFVLSRWLPEAQQYIAVYKSAVHSRTHAADWHNIELFKQFVCGGDVSTPVRISMYDYMSSDTNNYMGHFDTTLEDLIKAGETEFDIINEKDGKFNGTFTARLLENCESPRLFDYRLMGVQISATIAVDFSGSSVGLVYNNRGQHLDNGVFSYRYAINDVCDLMYPLTMGQPYFAYAFADFADGEKMKSLVPNRESDTISNAGILLRSYERWKRNAKFPKTASMLPVIQHTRERARKRWDDERTVTVLCVVTNGKFTDLDQAVDALVDLEDEPMCVILVVMGGTRRELEKAFKHRHGILTNSQGKSTTRRVLKMVTYLEDRTYPDPRLPKQLMPSSKAMTRKWLEHIDFFGQLRASLHGVVHPASV